MGTKLFVGSLPWSVNDDTLKAAFEAHGKVVSAKVITDRQSGRSKGYGFVEMAEESDANNAIQALNGKDLSGRNIVVSEAKSKG
ncbi:MAG: RNA-binding protein [Ignavibacteriaceae bacterium]|nr:RNA-binding protein [Ignavibacteriaceae bacterium]